jgi:ubiquinone/menaquinone biosynthesis C-methylase UbiE
VAETTKAARYVPAFGRERLTAFYDPVIRLTTRERSFKDRLLAQAGLGAGMEVLDLGCGTGTLALLAKRRVPSARVFGLDGDPKMLARARAKAQGAGLDVRFDEGLSTDLPYRDAQFDRVLSTLFFHHLEPPDKRRTVAEVARVLKPGGELHVADWGPATDPLMSALSVSIRLLDGAGPTRENFAGALPGIFERGGLAHVRTHGRMRTIYGALAFHSAARV